MDNRAAAAAVALVVLHFVFLMLFFAPAASSPDASGYLTQARLLAESGRTWFRADSPLQYAGPHWIEIEGRFFSRYPPGLPAAEAVAYRWFGLGGALALNPLLASLSLLGVFLIGWKWMGAAWGLLAAGVMAVNPIANTFALTGDSHAATAFLLVWGVCALAMWSESGSAGWGLAAGVLLGCIPAVRYPEALFGIGAAAFVGLHAGRTGRKWASLAAPCLGALAPLAALAARNAIDFGSPFRTAYAATGEQAAFSLAYFGPHSLIYMKNLLSDGAGAFAVLGPLGMITLLARPECRRKGVLLAGMAAPITVLYCCYYFAPAGMPHATLRFLLPALYLLALAGVWLLRILHESRISGARAATASVLAATVWWGLPQSLAPLDAFRRENRWLAGVTRLVSARVPAHAILIAPEQIAQQLDAVGRWRLAGTGPFLGPSRQAPPLAGGPEPAGGPDPVAHRIERERRLRERLGLSDGVELSSPLLAELDRWAQPGREIYWIGRLREIRERVPEPDAVSVVAWLPVRPHPSPEGGGRPPMGKGPPGGRHLKGVAADPGSAPLGGAEEPLAVVRWRRT